MVEPSLVVLDWMLLLVWLLNNLKNWLSMA